jgi:hypothetical protein
MSQPDGYTPGDDASLRAAVERLEQDHRALREEVARLDSDLDESRRLNLRAAELLDIVYARLEVSPPSGQGADDAT